MISNIMTGPGIKAPADYIEEVMSSVKSKNAAEPEFHQAVQEVVDSLSVVLEQHPEYRHEKILQRIIEPERVRIDGLSERASKAAGEPRQA